MQYASFLLLSVFIISCANQEELDSERLRRLNQTGEYIYRKHDEYHFEPQSAQRISREHYPWEKKGQTEYPQISKEFFRCKGCSLNPSRLVPHKGDESIRCHDCGGPERHSLPLHNGKESIYPILIDILNYLQNTLNHKVVITSGHRCPEHNTYVDATAENRFSKHLIGAEVDFYVQGMENRPEKIIQCIFQYYKDTPKYKELKEYQEFIRYDKDKTNVSTPPWFNKEIFVKLFLTHEGRNYDNRHPYPYISIQVRYDEETKERVNYTWEKAQHNFLRW